MFNKRNLNTLFIKMNLGFRVRILILSPTVSVRGDGFPTLGLVHFFYSQNFPLDEI